MYIQMLTPLHPPPLDLHSFTYTPSPTPLTLSTRCHQPLPNEPRRHHLHGPGAGDLRPDGLPDFCGQPYPQRSRLTEHYPRSRLHG